MRNLSSLSALLLAPLLAGCGGAETVDGPYSCTASLPSTSGGVSRPALCIEVHGGSPKDKADNQTKCANEHNTFADALCVRSSLLGGCRQQVTGGIDVTTWYYDTGDGGSSEDIRTICEGLAKVATGPLTITFVSP